VTSMSDASSAEQSRVSHFFDSLTDRFQEASLRTDVTHADVSLAGFHVRLEFAGEPMRRSLAPALLHRSTDESGEPDLRILIWDSVTSGVDMPPPAWSVDDYRERGLIRGFNDERFRTCFQIGPDTLNVLDLETNVGVQWIRDARNLPYYEKGAPLRHLLNWWMLDHDHTLVHAAAVSAQDRAALLVGRGGSGKSTTAFACLGGDLKYIGDDYCLVGPQSSPGVHSLYSTAKLTHDSLERFPDLAVSLNEARLIADDKLLLFLHPAYSHLLANGISLRTVFVPLIDRGSTATRIEPISKAEALLALAPSSIFQLSGAGGNEFSFLSEVIEQVECWRLRIGSDPASAAAAIYQHLMHGAR